MLVSPASIFDPKDPFTTGVVYMPIGLAYGATALQKAGAEVAVFDLFGEAPKRAEKAGEYVRLGASDLDLIKYITQVQPRIIIFYANQLLNHVSLIQSVKVVKKNFGQILVGVAENSQAVTAYSLLEVAEEIFETRADFIISGEMEDTLSLIVERVNSGVSLNLWKIDGLSTKNDVHQKLARISNLDDLGFPDWSLFPIENYWKLGYAHGPFETKSYLPLLTSRGCPFPCKFCVVPATNNRKWRFRSPENVVDEITFLIKKFGVNEFHLEDLNPTIQDMRMQQIALEIIRRDLDIIWKIVAGTKIESIKSVETLRLMKESGLNYLSMSPESGSKRVLKEIGKPFDVGHAELMIRECYKLGIKTQACFVLGYPTENTVDRIKSLLLAVKLTIAGVDEIVVFIMSPVPGSAVYKSYIGQFESLSSLSFSPRWRIDFTSLLIWRFTMYSMFLATKFAKNPKRMFRQIGNLLSRRFQTKMEMAPVRGLIYLKIAMKLSKATD
jgi:anaerobic magnesium-protoporphyrin IX monomethyl ester cyclase